VKEKTNYTRYIQLPWGQYLSRYHGSGKQLQDNQSRKSS